MLPDLPENMSAEQIESYIEAHDFVPVNRTVQVDDNLYQYLIDSSVREPELLKQLRAETTLYHMARMQVSPETGQFLALLIKLKQAKRILEVGVFTGYSTLSMGLAMSDDAKLVAIDKKQMWLDIANRYIKRAGLQKQIQTRCGKALDVLHKLMKSEAGTYDFVFIDADKINQLAYYKQAKVLLKSGGCIAIDNTLWWGNVAKKEFTDKDTQLVRELNAYIHQDSSVDIAMIPIGDGLTLIHKK
ncbi:SAM-dependent methyltransferase [Marinomonas agarivorans]|nr:SAM-dependent methyltransferase [Marinomonas agarivorans]